MTIIYNLIRYVWIKCNEMRILLIFWICSQQSWSYCWGDK